MPNKSIEQKCRFSTERLLVESWKNHKGSKKEFAQNTIDILSPGVTQSLPEGWQSIKSIPKALQWLNERDSESHFLCVKLLDKETIIGYVFLYESESQSPPYELRFGYLLAEQHWGKGLGTELIKGLLTWCRNEGNIKSISGGVETDNIGSIKVLKKTGFTLSPEKGPSDRVVFYVYSF